MKIVVKTILFIVYVGRCLVGLEIRHAIEAILHLCYALLGLVHRCSRIFHRNSSVKLPSVTDELVLKSVGALADMIRKRQVTSRRVVGAFIDRINQVDPILHCVTEHRFAAALQDADRIDSMLQDPNHTAARLEAHRPLLGVPFTVKESIAVEGMKHTLGMLSRRDYVAKHDADVVRLMKEAGAIVLAHTNTPEACMGWDSYNKLHGRTNNVYDTTRTAGGSSGGEAALVSACGSPVGLGSDIAGSIRVPCLFNGVFGLKPSSSVVSNNGHLPTVSAETDPLLVIGPICKYAEDLRIVYSAIVRPEYEEKLGLRSLPKIPHIKFYYLKYGKGWSNSTLFSSPIDKRIRLALKELRQKIDSTSQMRMIKVELNLFKHQLQLWIHKVRADPEQASAAKILGIKHGFIGVVAEVAKCCVGLSEHTAMPLVIALLGEVIVRDTKAVMEVERLRRELISLLGDDGVLICVSHPTPPPHCPLFTLLDISYAGIFNALRMPVVQVPLAMCSADDGSWVHGVQLVAAPGNERLCLAAAQHVQALTGGWRNPAG